MLSNWLQAKTVRGSGSDSKMLQLLIIIFFVFATPQNITKNFGADFV